METRPGVQEPPVGQRLTPPPPPDLDEPALYLNRELSWLEFNRRVLAHADDERVPPLERLRFLAIFASNLDEFFMVRVAGLKRQVAVGLARRTADGLTAGEQLKAIAEALRPLLDQAAACLDDHVLPLLARHGVPLVSVQHVSVEQRAALDRFFDAEVFPVLTPLAVDPGHPFPYISNLSLSLAVTVRDRHTGDRHFARVKVPGVLPRFVQLADTHGYVPLEELIAANVEQLFPGMEVLEAYPFRVTRNADLELEEDEAEDLLLAIEQELRKRRFGQVVRLEVAASMPERVVRLLQEELDVIELDTYRTPGLLGAGDLEQLADLDVPALRWEPWHPVTPASFSAPVEGDLVHDIFAEIRRGDLLVHHPYDSFAGTVERFITTASEDPQVLAIKQTLYRTAGDSPIVQALIRAAERGKQVVALVELKARFDEEANIVWARALEKAGVHVVYGLVGLKTHAKTTLVVRREPDGIRRYVHVGSGNYNARTARLYTDVGLFSCDGELGADLSELFNYLTGYARQDRYRRLMVAPVALREQLTGLIRREADRRRAGQPGMIRMKVNSLVDPAIIAELYRAAQAGVQVDLLVRGICCLRPGIPGVSDGIRVTSIVGRLLEHSRIFQFGPDDFWIGSADIMPRNLDRRVEVVAPVRDPALRDQLRGVLDRLLADTVQSWGLEADGTWRRYGHGDGTGVQEELMAQAAAER